MDRDLNAVSDGKLYGLNDMVKVGCRDCAGCSDCCRRMGDSVVLDPFDLFQLEKNLGKTFEELLAGPVELHVEEGLILPNLKMLEDGGGACVFLNGEGRCAIHAYRPGLCRLFPLGRNYEDGEIRYFLLAEGCPAKNRTKMKVGKWLDTDRLPAYEEFLTAWHDLIKRLRADLAGYASDEVKKKRNLDFLKIFYLSSWEEADFYPQFWRRLEDAERILF